MKSATLEQTFNGSRQQSSRTELVLALILGLLSAGLFTIPELAGYHRGATDDLVYLGFLRADDYHRYGSFMEQAKREHRLLFLDHSAVEPQTPRILAIYFWVLGVIARGLGLTTSKVWIVSRFVVSPFLFLAVTGFLRRLFPQNVRLRHATLGMIAAASGIELLLVPLYEAPRLKNYWMDGFSTFQLHHNPLKVVAVGVGVLLLSNLLSYFRQPSAKSICLSCWWFLLLWALHPNTAMVHYFTLGLLPLGLVRLANRNLLLLQWLRFMAPHAIPAALLGWFIYWMNSDPIVAHIIKCYQVSAWESLLLYPIRYGLVLLLGVIGVYFSLKSRSAASAVLVLWLAVAVGFSLAKPLTGLLFQHNVHLPLAIVAMVGLNQLPVSPRIKRLVYWASIGIGCITNLAIVGQVTMQTRQDVWPTSLYLRPAEYSALHKLGQVAKGNVLANRDIGNKVGYLSLQNAFLGHWGTTPYRGRKEQEFQDFWLPETPLVRKISILHTYTIRYILYTERERALGFPDPRLPIRKIFTQELVEIYEVIQEPSVP